MFCHILNTYGPFYPQSVHTQADFRILWQLKLIFFDWWCEPTNANLHICDNLRNSFYEHEAGYKKGLRGKWTIIFR